jgi:rhomboid family protein
MLTGSIIGDIKYQFRYGNMVVKLIFVNIAVFVFFGLLLLISYLTQSSTFYNYLLNELQVTASLHALLYQPWSVFTYMFLHVNVFHILFNMLWLYWFGEIFILYLGDKKILPLYIIGGLGGALLYIFSYNLFPVFKPVVNHSYMLGASASIYAIVFAAATLNPNHELGLILIGNVKIKYVAIVSLLLSVLTIPHDNPGGGIAHLGGALTGYLYIVSLRNGFTPFGSFSKLLKRKPKVKVSYRSPDSKVAPTARSKGEQEKVDEILDKIARSGYDSLSKEERDFLFNYSKK